MTEPTETLKDEVERLRKEAAEMDRPDRQIPLPKDDDEDDGVGAVTGVVP